MRKIIHIDMDCFYAAIECRDDPSVADKPVGVGGHGQRSVLTTCNYLARQFGCRSAMPVYKALQLCPHLVLKPVRFEAYREESRRIRNIFSEYTELVEPLSLDEAYLDVSHRSEYAWDLSKKIRAQIFETTGLTASAGIAPNKMLAKIASDWRKPNGQYAVLPDQIHAFMQELPIRKLWGVGPKTAERLKARGYTTCAELQALDLENLAKLVGPNWCHELHQLCRGIDEREVNNDRIRKSMSVERTYATNLDTLEDCEAELPELLAELHSDLAKAKGAPPFSKILVKLKFADFQRTTKERSGDELTVSAYLPLLAEAFARSQQPVRLIGVGLRFDPPEQPKVFTQLELPLWKRPLC